MSILTKIKSWLGFETEPDTVKKETTKKRSPLHALAVFAMVFVFGFALLAVAAPPAQAATINLTVISDVIDSFVGLIEPITTLVISIIPLWFIMQILAFIMGLLAAILAMIKFGKMR